MARKIPNPIDEYVGARVRTCRLVQNLSQEKLGEALGVTFQQVQKYEKGVNRIGASRLQQIAATLQVPVAFFFDGAPAAIKGRGTRSDNTPEAVVAAVASTVDGLALIKAFSKIVDKGLRLRIVELVEHIAKPRAHP